MFVFLKKEFQKEVLNQSKGLSCRDIAALCDLSAATISRVQNGSMPSLETVVKICMGLWLDPRCYFAKSEGVTENQMRLL